ncbi:MAG: lysophospholipid acyltransferase family protein [Rickettsiales bacterium]
MKKIKHVFELLSFSVVYLFMRLLPYRMSSLLMGKLFSSIGPWLPVTSVAYKNLGLAFPRMSQSRKKEIIKKMWCNLGRVVGEYPKTFKLSKGYLEKHVKIHGFNNVKKSLKKNKGAIILTGHYGNWENSLAKMTSLGCNMAVVYRKINNPYIDQAVLKIRGQSGVEQIPKSVFGVKKIIASLRDNRLVCLLSDQKQNDGIASDFFGHKVMTGILASKLALQRGIDLLPLMSVRGLSKGTDYDIYVEEPINIAKGDDLESITAKINAFYQRWIEKHPEQWFWLHRRWPKNFYKK